MFTIGCWESCTICVRPTRAEVNAARSDSHWSNGSGLVLVLLSPRDLRCLQLVTSYIFLPSSLINPSNDKLETPANRHGH